MRTVDNWIDTNMNLIKGKKIRVLEASTGKGVGDRMIFYMHRNVINYKVTSKFVFLYVE